MIRVLLCDDHALIRRGIRDTLSDAPDIEVVGEAGDYGELRTLMRGTTLILSVPLLLADAAAEPLPSREDELAEAQYDPSNWGAL